MSDFRDTSAAASQQLVLGYALGAASAGYVNVAVGGEVVSVMAHRDTTYAASDPVLLAKVGSQWLALGRYGTAAPTQPDIDKPPAPKPEVTTGTLVIAPVSTRSYRASYGWRTDNSDVYQGQYGGWGNHTGCAFYGSKPQSLEGATVTSASIRVRRGRGGNFADQTTTLWLVTESTKPATAAPTRTSSTTGPRLAVGETNNSFTIPTSWAQAMVDGTAGGLAIFDSSGSPYVVLNGKGTWSPAFTLTIRWTR